jgi:HK97 family phage major capsid protein
MDAAAIRKSKVSERAFYWKLYRDTIRGDRRENVAELAERIEKLDREIVADSSREISLADLLKSGRPFHVPGMQRRVDGGRVTVDTRALGKSTATGGGDLVPIDFVSEMRDFLATRSSIFQLNTTVLPIPGKRLIEIPSRTASGTAVLTGEGTAFPASDPTFGQVTLSAYKYGKLMDITTELTQDIGVPLDGMIARQAAMSFELGYGPRFASDVAHTNGPQGLFSTVAIGATAHTGSTGVPSYTDFNNLLYSVPAQYRTIDSQWLLPANSIPQIREVVDVGGYPIFQPATITGESDRLLGFPVVVDANISALGTAAGTAIMFGDMSGYYVRDAGIEIEGSVHTKFNVDVVEYKAVHTLDGAWVDNSGVRSMLSPTS